MKTLSTFVLTLYSGLVLAAPAALERRCYVGDASMDVIDTIYSVALSKGANSKVMLATFECAAVESNYNNLDCGDQDSVGVFQQRPSMGWGSIEQLMNVNYASNQFLDKAIAIDKAQPGLSPGQLAQAVQISEFPFRYDESESKARGYLNQAISRKGATNYGGGAANVVTVPSSSSSSGSSSSNSKCGKTYKVVKGDSCSKLANAGGISMSKLLELNSNLNSGCTNLQIGVTYCIGAGSSAPAPAPAPSAAKATVPSNIASGTTKTCKAYYTIQKGNTCSTLTSKGGLALAKLRTLNTGINSSCNNLTVGKAYCVAA